MISLPDGHTELNHYQRERRRTLSPSVWNRREGTGLQLFMGVPHRLQNEGRDKQLARNKQGHNWVRETQQWCATLGHRDSRPEPGGTGPDELRGEEDNMRLAAHTATILQAFKDTKLSLKCQIAAVVNEVGLLRDDQRKLMDRDKESEDQLSNVTPQVADLTKNLKPWIRNCNN
ncbi:hypothetical protein NDU88_001294 [Pleurodeles waltl]|uniref:Uncharacterized protein n=1 Tax=Pleurodeles waltl TaxID=8319 RepID=A0AAV7Q9E2_PLEWA|nr:hypothetical protein NDU88_001294 [Pleurodeles waltl]